MVSEQAYFSLIFWGFQNGKNGNSGNDQISILDE